MFKRSLIILLFVTLVLTLSFSTMAQEWPNDPIRIIVGYGSGGSTDITTRHVARELEHKLGVDVIVENKPGGGGTVAASLTLNQPADGNHLLILTSAPSFIAPHMQEDITFNPIEDFTQVCNLAKWRYSLVVADDSPWEDLEDFIEYSKDNPGTTYATSGVGNAQDLVMRYLMVEEEIDWKIVPYQTGTEGIAAVAGGHADAYAGVGEWVPMAEDGKVRPIVMFDETRNPEWPDIPTLKELGYDIVAPSNFTLAGPAGIPEERVKILADAVEEIVNTEEYEELLSNYYMIVNYLGPEETREMMQETYEQTGVIVEEAGLAE